MVVFAIYKLDTINSKILIEKYNLEDYNIFTRNTIKNVMRVLVREVSEQSRETAKAVVVTEKLNDTSTVQIFTIRKQNARVVAITDKDYNIRVGIQLINEAFKEPNYDKLIKEYKVWKNKDRLTQLEDQLAQSNVIMANGLAEILERGETISELVDKSENLSMQTKMLFRTAKKKNSCC